MTDKKEIQESFEPELIKNILLDAKNIPRNEVANGFSYPQYSQYEQKIVDKYTHLLTEEDYLNGFPIREVKNFFRITGLSEKGEALLENANKEELWEKAIEKCKEKEITTLKGLQYLLSHNTNA